MKLRIVSTIAITACLWACGSKTTGTAGATTGGTTSSTTTTSGTTTSTTSTGAMTVNGCTADMAEDHLADASYDITKGTAWGIPHQMCVKVKAGTTVTWTGDFTGHPLTGGATGTEDAGSPITAAGKVVNTKGMGTASAMFAAAGAFPYYCTIHLASMQGVVYVE